MHCGLDIRCDERAHAFDVMRRIVARDVAPFHVDLAALGDDVEDGTTLDGADMDRGVRRVEAVLERAFLCQPPRFGGDVGDRLAGGLYGVDALAGFA
jgi:hypothetical protein